MVEENWGIAMQRVQQFFCSQPDVCPIPQGFQFADCKITLFPAAGMLMGKWPQERTVIRIEGPDAQVREIYQRFFLRFLSAGG